MVHEREIAAELLQAEEILGLPSRVEMQRNGFPGPAHDHFSVAAPVGLAAFDGSQNSQIAQARAASGLVRQQWPIQTESIYPSAQRQMRPSRWCVCWRVCNELGISRLSFYF